MTPADQLPEVTVSAPRIPDDMRAALDTFDSSRADLTSQRARENQAESDVEATEAQRLELDKARLSQAQRQADEIEKFGGLAPQDHIDHVMRQAPLFMALAALAGGGQRTSSLTALSSLNGAMQGILKGDQQQFADAQQRYDQQYTLLKDKWAARQKVYDELEKSYGDTESGQLRRWQIANAAIGEDERTAAQSLQYMTEMNKLQNQINYQQENLKIKRDTLAQNAANQKRTRDEEQERIDLAASRVTATNKKNTELVGQMGGLIDQIEQKIKANPGQTTGAGGMVSRVANVAKGAVGMKQNTAPTDVKAQLDQLNVLLAEYEKNGRPSDAFVKLMGEITGGSSLLSNDANTLSRLNQLKQMLGVEKSSIGGGRTYKSVDEVKKAFQSGEIDYPTASGILTSQFGVSPAATPPQ